MSNDITQRLNNLFEDDLNAIENQKERIKSLHEGANVTLRHASELSGIDADLLLTCIVQATFHHATISWYEALELFRAIMVNKKRIEEQQANASFYLIDTYALTSRGEFATYQEAIEAAKIISDETGLFIYKIIKAVDKHDLHRQLAAMDKGE